MIERPGTRLRSRANRDREIVQRTAELLASDLSLEELFSALCALIGRFIDASLIFVALKDTEGESVAFIRENGVEAIVYDRRVRADSQTAKVFRTGEPILKRKLEDWTDGRLALNLPGEPQNDERISAIFVPLQFGTEVIGVLSVQSLETEAYDDEDVAMLRVCAIYLSVRIHQAQLEEQSERLRSLASTDSLTGVANRRAFDERLIAEWRRSLRSTDSMSLIMIDIDLFKTFNDTYGHVAGDAILQQIATTLASCATRPQDVFARYGGEEFVAVLPDTDLQGAVIVAERMREAVASLSIVHSGSQLKAVTISLGVASLVPQDANPAHLVEAADAALYQAKSSGRNRVVAEDYRSNTPPTKATRRKPEALPDVIGHTFGSPDHLTQIRKVLRTARLLTIVGPAGIGKSRLALEAAHRDASRFPDGIFYLDCSMLGDAHDFQSRLADLLGVPETNAVAAGSTLAEMLRTKRTLVILDNCDDIAGDASSYIKLMLDRARAARILATAREPLYIPAEISFGVSPLDRNESVAFFSSVAGSQPNVSVEALCVELKGVPRAIELTAAQARTVDLDEISQRLADLGSRVETAAGILEWSYSMLSPDEAALLRAMSVFFGGASREAIDAVCDSPTSLTALVGKAMVFEEITSVGTRFTLPASVRSVALRAAQTHGDWTKTSHKHARFLLDLVRRDDPAALALEQANLAATLQFTIGKGNDIHLGAELTVALVRHWLRIARNKAGLAWIDLLMLYADDFSKGLRADVLAAYAHLDVMRTKAGLDAALEAIAMYRELGDEDKLAAPLFDAASAYAAHGDLARADDLYEESLAIARRKGDKRRIADTLMGMGLAEHYRSNWYRATTLLEESLDLYREIGDDRCAALQLGNLGDLAASSGDLDRAVSLARQSLAIFERLRLPHWIAWQLVNLGTFELSRGEKDAARPALQRGLEIVHDLQEPWFTAGALDSLARLAVADGKPARAMRLTGYADALIDSLGVPRQPSDELEYRRVLREAIEALGDEAAGAAMEHGRAMPWVEVLNEAMKA